LVQPPVARSMGSVLQAGRLSIDEAAFLDACTLPADADIDQVLRCFKKWGVVRFPEAITATGATGLLKEAEQVGLRRDAFGQRSQSDRYTLWLSGDDLAANGWISEEDGEGGSPPLTIQERPETALHDAVYGSGMRPCWRELTRRLGASHFALAEAVVSLPGGSSQEWHFDGGGVTLQLALADVEEVNGPTELTPRGLSSAYVDLMTNRDAFFGEVLQMLRLQPSELPAKVGRGWATAMERPLYDVLTGLQGLAWSVLRPRVSREQAAWLIELGLLPPVVRLTADAGLLTAYDASMIHRGGENRGATPRPILAIHMRDASAGYGPAPTSKDTPAAKAKSGRPYTYQ
jgi:hypothetical protein